MDRFPRLGCLVLAVVAAGLPTVAMAQFPSELVGFNGPPIGDFTAQEMFRIPEWSLTTNEFVFLNPPNSFDNNYAARFAGLQTEGAAALQVSYRWIDPSDPDGWVRLSTYNGPERPNPGLHLGGKVRFKLTNRSQLFEGEIGVCLGIRETGMVVPQMQDGGADGTIEWVGVDPTPNGIMAGDDNIVDTQATGDDIQEYPVGTNIGPDGLDLPSGTAVVSVGSNGALDTDPAGDDQVRFGFRIGANGNRVPIPAVTLPPDPAAYALEWNLVTGDVTVNGTPHDGGIAGFTGDGQLLADPLRGTLEHVALTNVPADTAELIEFAIDEMQFEAPEPDPVFPPRVVWPIIAGDMDVTVTDLVGTVNQVSLYRNDDLVEARDVTNNDDVTFTLDPTAIAGEVFTATQRSGDEVSDQSPGVTVLPEPPPYTFSLLIDEGGTGSCSTSAGWEWVGVSGFEQMGSDWYPQGLPVFADDAVWQTIDVPLDDDGLIIAGLGGDGMLDTSPSGYYTIDSIWFTESEGLVNDPWEVFIDRVQLIDATGQISETILDMEDGVSHFPFERGQSQDLATSLELTGDASFDGAYSHYIEWTYDDVLPESLGILQRVGADCGTSELIDDSSQAIRFHVLLRGQPENPAVPLPQIVGPIIVGTQDTVRVLHEATATSVDLYVNGEMAASQGTSGTTQTDFAGLSLQREDSVSARQTVPSDGESDFAYPRGVSDVPPPPWITEPVLPGSETVTVTNVLTAAYATATEVALYVNGSLAGTAAGGTETVIVSAGGELQPGDLLTATQTVNGVTSDLSAEVAVELTSALSDYEFAPTLAGLSRSLTVSDMLGGRIGVIETGDVDPVHGIEAWNMLSDECLAMAYTEPSPGFHVATPPQNGGGLADLTDGVPGTTVEAVLADYNRVSLVVRYDFDPPANLEEMVVFAANEDPGAPNNGRLFQHYDVWVSKDNTQTFQPLALAVATGEFGFVNENDDRATFTHVYDGVSDLLDEDVTNLRFVFYDVSNTGGRFVDPWQGNANEGAAYQTLCPDVEPQDTDGFRKAFEAPIIKEIDVFGFVVGDVDGDGDLDATDWAGLGGCMTGPLPNGPAGPGCEVFDFAPADGDIDLLDAAVFQTRFTGDL